MVSLPDSMSVLLTLVQATGSLLWYRARLPSTAPALPRPRSCSNPLCEDAPGCGPWTRPNKANPSYKGKWYAPLIDNPLYKGIWKCVLTCLVSTDPFSDALAQGRQDRQPFLL